MHLKSYLSEILMIYLLLYRIFVVDFLHIRYFGYYPHVEMFSFRATFNENNLRGFMRLK